MSQQPSETGDRPSISGDSGGCFIYIQGGWNQTPPGNLSCRNSGHTWPAERTGSCRLAETLATGGGKMRSALCNGGPGFCVYSRKGLLFWIRRGWGESGHQQRCCSHTGWQKKQRALEALSLLTRTPRPNRTTESIRVILDEAATTP